MLCLRHITKLIRKKAAKPSAMSQRVKHKVSVTCWVIIKWNKKKTMSKIWWMNEINKSEDHGAVTRQRLWGMRFMATGGPFPNPQLPLLEELSCISPVSWNYEYYDLWKLIPEWFFSFLLEARMHLTKHTDIHWCFLKVNVSYEWCCCISNACQIDNPAFISLFN